MNRWIALLAVTALALPVAPAVSETGGWHSTTRNGEPVVTGSGRIVRDARPISNFSAVEVMGSTHLQVQLGRPLSLVIEADDNLLPHLTSAVENGTLRLDTRGSFRTRTAPRVFLTAPNAESITTSGSGNVVIIGVDNRKLDLVSRGSGNLVARGRTGQLNVTVKGSGNAYMQGISASSSDVSVLGSGNAWVKSPGAVRARSFGSGNVYVMGRPASLDVARGGSGRVIRVGGR